VIVVGASGLRSDGVRALATRPVGIGVYWCGARASDGVAARCSTLGKLEGNTELEETGPR
jgi:hypothetical protein